MWAVLRVVMVHFQDGTGDDAALAALNLLSLGLHHLTTAAAAAAGPSALPPALAALLEQGLRGFSPGLLGLLREIAAGGGQAPGGAAAGGRRREYGWELTACSQHLVGVIEGLLQRQQAPASAPAAAEGSAGAEAAGVPISPPQQAAHQGAEDEAAQRRERARLKREKMLAKMKVRRRGGAGHARGFTLNDLAVCWRLLILCWS